MQDMLRSVNYLLIVQSIHILFIIWQRYRVSFIADAALKSLSRYILKFLEVKSVPPHYILISMRYSRKHEILALPESFSTKDLNAVCG